MPNVGHSSFLNYPRTPVYSNTQQIVYPNTVEGGKTLSMSRDKQIPVLASDFSGAKSFPSESTGAATPMACSRKLEFSNNPSEPIFASERTKVQGFKATSYSCQSVPGKASMVKVTALEFNLPQGHPEKCSRPECHNRRFVTEDGGLKYYCSKACERTEHPLNFTS
jgi:hypothetical protein